MPRREDRICLRAWGQSNCCRRTLVDWITLILIMMWFLSIKKYPNYLMVAASKEGIAGSEGSINTSVQAESFALLLTVCIFFLHRVHFCTRYNFI